MTPEPLTLETRGAGGVRLHLLVWPAERPVGRVLVVHGFGEHAGRYDLLAESLTAAGWTVTAYDQRGHGESEGRRGVVPWFEILVDDLAAVHHALDDGTSGPAPTVLLGHSMGGLVLARYLQRRPRAVDAAVLSAPWLATALDVPAWRRAAAWLLLRLAPDLTLTNEHRAERLTRDPERARAYLEDPLVHRRISPRFWYGALEAQRAVLEDPRAPGLPLLVLIPGDDPVVDSEVTLTWTRRLPDDALDVEWLEERRHEPFNDLGREAVFDLLVRWLARNTGVEPARVERVSSTNPSGPPVFRETPDDPDPPT